MPRKTLQTSVKKGAREAARKKAVKAGNDFCQALFEWGDDAIFLFDRIGRCLDVNPSGCRLLGSSPRRLRSRLLTELLLSLNGSDDCRRLQGLRRGQTKSCGLRVCRDDGREVPVDARAKGLAQGCVLVVLRERSVSLPIHEQLRESERFLDSVLEYLPGIVFIKDAADLRFVRFNKAGVELLGYTRDELLGKNDYDCFPQHEADFFTAKDREVLASGRLLDIAEEPIQTRVNGMRLLHTKKVPILDEHGRPQYLLGLSEDITEQYQQRVRDADRRQQLKRLAELSLTLSGDPDEVFDQAVRIIGELFSVKVVCVSEIVGRDLHFKSVYVNGKVFRDIGGCPLAVTPCATVEKNKDLRIFDHVTERFPQATFLKDHQAVGYCGFPATGHSGRVVAVTCLLDDKPLALTEDEQDILRIFGQRIATEIERAGHIAEQKRVECRLRSSEARMEFLLSASPAIIYSCKVTGDYGATFVSDNVTKLLGYTPDDFIADPGFWASHIHPDDHEQVFARLPSLFEAGGHAHEYRFLHKDGTYRWMRDELRVIHDAAGRPAELVGCWYDITERKRAEEALRESERQLTAAQHIAHLGYWHWDLSTDRLEWSDETKKILKYRPDMGNPTMELLMRFVHPDDLPLILANHEILIKTGRGPDMEYRIVRDDGEIRTLFAQVEGVVDTNGRFVQAFGTVQDITDRKCIENVLRASEERLRLALYAAKQGLYDLDLTTGKAEVNDEYAMMLGYTPAEFEETNARWTERLHPDDRKQVYGAYEAYVRGEIPAYEVEFRQRTKSGDWKWIHSIGSIVERDTGGRPLRMLGTHLDITERKQTELALKRQEALLESFFSQSLDGCFFMMLDEPVEWNGGVDKDQVLEQIFARQRITRVNDAMLAQYGGVRERFLGLTPNDLLAHNLSYPKELWRSMLDQGRLAIQTIEQKLDGTPMWIEGEYVCLYDEQGRFSGHFGVQREITAQKRMEEELRRNEVRLSEAQRLAKLGNWELDLLSNHLVWSDEIFRIFEIDKARFKTSYEAFLNAVHPDDRAMVNGAYTTSVAEHQPYMLVHRLLMPDGRIKYVQEHGETDYDESGRPIRSRGTVQDVTDRRLAELHIENALQEKVTLLREVHHRAKNNLQIISSLLYFQAKKIRNPEDISVFQEGRDRLKSMILVHEKLYRSNDLTRIEFDDYVRALTEGICESYRPLSKKIDIVVDVPSMTLPLEIAMPAGMILNELLTNAFKYAFPDERGGVVRICVIPAEDAFEILVEDTGVGFPGGVNPERPETFGLQLIYGLTSQLGGRVSFKDAGGSKGGSSVRVHVPIPVRTDERTLS